MKEKIKNLILSIRPYSVEMTGAILGALLKQAAIMGAAGATSYLVGSVLAGKRDISWGLWIALLVVCMVGRSLFTFMESYLAHDVAFRVIRNFRLDIFRKISEIAPAYTQKKKTGQLGQTLVSDVEVLELFLAHTFSGFVVAFLVTIIVFVILLQISPASAILLLIGAFLLIMVPYVMKKRSEAQGKIVRETLAECNSDIIEGIQGLREIVTLNYKDGYKEKVRKSAANVYDSQKTFGKRKGLESMLTMLISGGFMTAVMLLCAAQVRSGAMEFPVYTTVVVLSSLVLAPVSEAAGVAQDLGLVLASADRIQKVLAEIPAVADEGTCDARVQTPEIRFSDVTFAYEKDGDKVLDQVSFTIKSGEMVALVGVSGAGKTTCANLLLRYYDPQSGSIQIGGRDLREYKLETLREMVSAVPQDPFLFHTSIKENLKLGVRNATDEDMYRAADAANADGFIRGLPAGYDTMAGEDGYQLSGGQRQRIAIARTLLRDTPVVIFDEAVSSLDTENEQEIQETLKKLMRGKTVVTIAHRMSTILYADRVIMLKEGQVAAVGTHKELLETSEAYRKLLANQTNTR